MNHSRLNDYIRSKRGKSFQLGVHDCFTFTNGAWIAMYGHEYSDITGYHKLGRKGLAALIRDRFNADTIEGAFDANMTRVHGVPPRGAIVASDKARWITGIALGIANGSKAVFVGDCDLVYVPIDEICAAWVE